MIETELNKIFNDLDENPQEKDFKGILIKNAKTTTRFFDYTSL
jgi:hypothetical protein